LIPEALPGGGRGLIGLRERVILCGGQFEAGRLPRGGWRIMARFPVEAAPVSAATAVGDAATAAGIPPVPALS